MKSETIVIEVIDLQEYSKLNKKPTVGKHYQTLVDDELVVFEKEKPTGLEVLLKAGKKHPECHSLYVKRKGCDFEYVSLEQHIDLTQPGVEIFITKPPVVFHYDFDDEPETTDLKEMTPNQILKAGGVSHKNHYLVQISSDGSQVSYKDKGDELIKMKCPKMKFISVLNGPTPVS